MMARHTIRMIGLMLGGSMLPGMALAQEAAPQDAAAHDFADEIIVTAQKREQSLQDVPIVVTVVNAQLLQDAGVRDIKDLTVLTPGLTVVSTDRKSTRLNYSH